MNAFISWSGGKDCMFALHTFSQDTQNQACYLVNFSTFDGTRSNLHGLDKELIYAQSVALGIPLIQKATTSGSYEIHLKKVISDLKLQGIEAGVFGDIYLQEHRTWIERVCEEMGIGAVFPLWGKDTATLLNDFIGMDFRTILVSVRNEEHLTPLLGRELDDTLRLELALIENIDPCGENGEFHSFVFDGPIFKQAIAFSKGEKYVDGNHLFLPIYLEIKN